MWKQHPATVHTKCRCFVYKQEGVLFVWSGLCLFAFFIVQEGLEHLASVSRELGLEGYSTMPSCLSQMPQVHSHGCPMARLNSTEPMGLTQTPARESKATALATFLL